MTLGLTNVINITGTNALLAGGYSSAGRNLLSGKVRLQGCHTCIDKKQGIVIVGHEGEALH